jgi:hypothetical protein
MKFGVGMFGNQPVSKLVRQVQPAEDQALIERRDVFRMFAEEVVAHVL